MTDLAPVLADLNNQSTDYDFSNHHLIRFFRCFMDGSYKGEAHYHANQRAAKTLSATEAIEYIKKQFTEYLHTDSYAFEQAELDALFTNERFLSEVKEDFYNLVQE